MKRYLISIIISISIINSQKNIKTKLRIDNDKRYSRKHAFNERSKYKNIGNRVFRFRQKISKDKPPETHLSFPTDIDFREVKHEPMVSPTKTCTDSLSCVFIVVREYHCGNPLFHESQWITFLNLFSPEFHEIEDSRIIFKSVCVTICEK